jgi:hypothetical protein
MKQTLLLLTLIVGTILGASAQCTPNTSNFTSGVYVYPSSLDTVWVGTAYPAAQVISIEIPDSLPLSDFGITIVSGTVLVDSVKFDSIGGYPTGITSVSSPALGTTWLKPGQFACAIFSGTAVHGDAIGPYNLNIIGSGCGHFVYSGTAHDSCFPVYNFSNAFPYKLIVDTASTSHVGISEIASGLDLNIFPNPNQGNFTVNISSMTSITGTMSVVDQLGRVLHTQSIDVAGTKQVPLELGDIAPGAYLLMINAEGARSVKQFIVK